MNGFKYYRHSKFTFIFKNNKSNVELAMIQYALVQFCPGFVCSGAQ